MSNQEREQFVSKLKVGDEVCITNKYDFVNMLFSGFLGKTERDSSEVCRISTVQSVLENDGGLVIDNMVFNNNGELLHPSFRDIPTELDSLKGKLNIIEPTDELRNRSTRLSNIKLMQQIDWSSITDEAVDKISALVIELGRDCKLTTKQQERNESDL